MEKSLIKPKQQYHLSGYESYFFKPKLLPKHFIYNLESNQATWTQILELTRELFDSDRNIVILINYDYIIKFLGEFNIYWHRFNLISQFEIPNLEETIKGIKDKTSNGKLAKVKICNLYYYKQLELHSSIYTEFLEQFPSTLEQVHILKILKQFVKTIDLLGVINEKLKVETNTFNFKKILTLITEIKGQFKKQSKSGESRLAKVISEAGRTLLNDILTYCNSLINREDIRTKKKVYFLNEDLAKDIRFSFLWNTKSRSVITWGKPKKYEIYTDASLKHSTFGSFSGVLSTRAGFILEHWSYQLKEVVPSSNFVELCGVIFALFKVKKSRMATFILTDSSYVINHFEKFYDINPVTRKRPCKSTLDYKILMCLGLDIPSTLVKVKGHANTLGNLFVDRSASYGHIKGEIISWEEWCTQTLKSYGYFKKRVHK
ncbi:hypothetical protein K502DRAFT_362064 [Neoconidiobolus thromboides FSU 785]|nr:hypothetical protein K502DRAFT_362064 [Neoconidiobolus thromboides FSU 785]